MYVEAFHENILVQIISVSENMRARNSKRIFELKHCLITACLLVPSLFTADRAEASSSKQQADIVRTIEQNQNAILSGDIETYISSLVSSSAAELGSKLKSLATAENKLKIFPFHSATWLPIGMRYQQVADDSDEQIGKKALARIASQVKRQLNHADKFVQFKFEPVSVTATSSNKMLVAGYGTTTVTNNPAPMTSLFLTEVSSEKGRWRVHLAPGLLSQIDFYQGDLISSGIQKLADKSISECSVWGYLTIDKEANYSQQRDFITSIQNDWKNKKKLATDYGEPNDLEAFYYPEIANDTWQAIKLGKNMDEKVYLATSICVASYFGLPLQTANSAINNCKPDKTRGRVESFGCLSKQLGSIKRQELTK